MRHEHLVVTVESGTKARIEDDLESGETVKAWVADAIDAKLADGDATDTETNDGRTDTGGDRASGGANDGATDPKTADADRSEEDDRYDEGFEYVDDCSI